MKQTVKPAKMPTLEELIALLSEEAYWKEQHREHKLSRAILALRQSSDSLAALAKTAEYWNATYYVSRHNREPFIELYALIIAAHQNDAEAFRLYTEIKFKIDLWNGEERLAFAINSRNQLSQSKAYLDLGFLYQQSSAERRYEKACNYFKQVVKLDNPKDKSLALRKMAELHFEQGNEALGLKDLETSCRFDSNNPERYLEYGFALVGAKRYTEAEKASKQALLLNPNEPVASKLLETIQKHLSKAPETEESEEEQKTQEIDPKGSYISPAHEKRDELHAFYVERLTSTIGEQRQESFRRLLGALEPCKNEIDCLERVMSEANFARLLVSVPGYFEAEMPLHAEKLSMQNPHTFFEDCLTLLYLTVKAFMPLQHQMQFYSNMSKVLANKGYYYQDAPIKNTGQPLDALDYGMLALAYDSRDLLSYYQAGVEQITIEYYYHQGIAILQSTKEAIYHDNLKAEAIENDRKKAFESFLKQFDLLLKMVQKHEEYRSLREMQGWQQLHDYLKSPDLLDVFKRSFKFKLTQCVSQPRVLKNTCEFYWGLMHAWSQYALPNAKAALREFNKFLTEKLSKNPFYGIVMEQTNALLLQLERNEPSLVQASSIKVDIQQLIQETRERFIKLLDIGSDLNTLPVMVLQKRISEEAAVILNHLLSAIENTLGSAPCAFSILGLGSYSREEMSLCSDIDFAILISDKSHKEHPYFKHFLSMLVHLRRGLPPNVLTIESKDLQTLLSQDKSLMQTPTEMIAEHCPLYSSTELKAQKNRLSNALSYAVQRAWLIFNSQTEAQESKGLYENYQILLTNRLKSLGEASIPYYQMVGQVCLEEHFKEQNGSELVNLSLNPSKVVSINLKKTHLRPLTLWVLNVGTYFGIQENNTWKILDALDQQSRLSSLFVKELKEALTYIHTLRLRLHHAWLNQPRPAELPFDEWLEAPADSNVSASTRNFYLDAFQRQRLDIIQRHLIEPLTETISVFGATLPALQFDPVVHYFEQQFELLGVCKLYFSMSSKVRTHHAAIIQGRAIGIIKSQDEFEILCKSAESNYIIRFNCSEALKKELSSLNIEAKDTFITQDATTESIYQQVYKEVALNKGYTPLDEKLSVQLHCNMLSTLAEIALTRSHLLKPTPAFRDLLPHLKIAYLDMALERLKKSDCKEIEELKSFVQVLWHYPTEDGWRAESFRQERAWHEQLMHLVSPEDVPFPISNTISLIQDNKIRHYVLKPEIISQLVTEKGEWQPKDKEITGNHLVYRIMNKNQKETFCWAKIYPEQPGIEWLMLHLDQRLGVYGIPCSSLVNLHHNGQNTAILLSADVPHPNLLKTLKTEPQVLSYLNRAHFFKTLIRVLLTNPEDDKGDDYFLESGKEGLKLIHIDNERAFFAPELVGGFYYSQKLQVKSIIYCLDLLDEPIKIDNSNMQTAIQDFLQLKPFALLKNLLLELDALQPLWQTLFSEADIERHYYNEKPWISLPVLYVPQEIVKELSVRMDSLQSLLVLNPKITGLELLKAVQPELAKYYAQGFKMHPSNQDPYSQVCKRFDASPGKYYVVKQGNLLSVHGTEAATLSLRLTTPLLLDIVKNIWCGKIYTASALLKQIEAWEKNRMAEVYNGLIHSNSEIQREAQAHWQQLANRQRVLLFNDFSAWVQENPAANVAMQHAILSALPETIFHTLDLSAFSHSLEDKFLTPILKTGGAYLIALNLNYCQNLSEAIPSLIAENCPNLKTLNISNMIWKSFSTGLRGWSPVLLPKIEKLVLQNCQSLEYFIIEAPQAEINLQGCATLKYVQFRADLSFVAATQSRPGEYQYQLAKAYSLGTGVAKNLMQAYYWGQLAFEENHPSASLLCSECAYVTAKSYLLGDGVLRDINQAYHWARLSREHQYPLSEILCYALFNFYDATPLNGTQERLSCEKSTVSLVGKLPFTSLQTLKRIDLKTLALGDINESGLRLLSFGLAANNTLTHLDLRYNKICPSDTRACEALNKSNGAALDSVVEELLRQCEGLAALSLDALPITTLGKLGLLSASPLILPQLRSLTLKNLSQLSTFLLQTPQLTELQLVNIPPENISAVLSNTNYPALDKLSLSCLFLKQLGNPKAPLILPQLTSLVLEDLPQLIDITLQVPQLRQLEMRCCDALKSLETQSEHARRLLDKGIALSTEEPKQAAEQLDSALSLEPNHILKLIEIEQSFPRTLPDYISHSLRATPGLSILTPQFRIAQQLLRKLQEFLHYVAEGEQDKAEVLLQKYPALGLYPGDVTDLSKRSFKNITALQYAFWSLDWHMWMMLLKYIPTEAAAEQIAKSERGLWVAQHGITVDWENLVQALNRYVFEINSNKPYDVYSQTWSKKVGGAQLLLPAHVINEYCRPARPFYPTPDFTQLEPTGAWRSRATDEGEWFSAKYNYGTLGEGFAVYRGGACCASTRARVRTAVIYVGVEQDSTAVAVLLKTRQAQWAAAVSQYLPRSRHGSRADLGAGASASPR